MFPYFWNISNALFPLRYPMNPETLILGGILTKICIWSGHTSPSIISTPFHWHNCRNISRISNRFSQKNTFHLYFGANSIWYLQFQLVCAKLLLSMVTFFIDKSSKCVFLFDWQVKLIITYLENFFSSVNLFWTTPLWRGFRLQKATLPQGRVEKPQFIARFLVISRFLRVRESIFYADFRC